jgi:hypothetical protein
MEVSTIPIPAWLPPVVAGAAAGAHPLRNSETPAEPAAIPTMRRKSRRLNSFLAMTRLKVFIVCFSWSHQIGFYGSKGIVGNSDWTLGE